MKEMLSAVQKQTETGNQLKEILLKEHQLEKIKTKMQHVKELMKIAKADGDFDEYDRCKKKLKKFAGLSDSEERG